MSEYPYMFSDINVDMIVEKKEIVVKCVGGKEYKLKFGQFIMESTNAINVFRKYMKYEVGFTDNFDFFEN